MLAAVPITLFLIPACRKCGRGPLLLALAGLATMTIGRIGIDSVLIVSAGALAMFGAALWTAVVSGTPRRCAQSHSSPA